MTDDFYQYEVDKLASNVFAQPVLKLIKRQVSDGKEKEKKLLTKSMSETDSENSSNNKPVSHSGSQVAVLTDEQSKFDLFRIFSALSCSVIYEHELLFETMF